MGIDLLVSSLARAWDDAPRSVLDVLVRDVDRAIRATPDADVSALHAEWRDRPLHGGKHVWSRGVDRYVRQFAEAMSRKTGVRVAWRDAGGSPYTTQLAPRGLI